MPTDYIKKLSREGKGTIPELEKKWSDAKEIATKEGDGNNYSLVTDIFKKMIKANTVTSIKINAARRLIANKDEDYAKAVALVDRLGFHRTRKKGKIWKTETWIWVDRAQAFDNIAYVSKILHKNYERYSDGTLIWHISPGKGISLCSDAENAWVAITNGMSLDKIAENTSAKHHAPVTHAPKINRAKIEKQILDIVHASYPNLAPRMYWRSQYDSKYGTRPVLNVVLGYSAIKDESLIGDILSITHGNNPNKNFGFIIACCADSTEV